MAKTKEVQLRYKGWKQHYEHAAHEIGRDSNGDPIYDRSITENEIHAGSERIVDDLHLVNSKRPEPIDQGRVVFNMENNYTNTVLRKAADWLIENEGADHWEIIGEGTNEKEVEIDIPN